MSSTRLTCDMLVLREIVRTTNPDLLRWTEQRWQDWRFQQRNMKSASRRLVAVATLSCVDDLIFHVGLMQLLGLSDVQITLVLIFPTEQSARLARSRARRDEWELLVHIVVGGEFDEMLRSLGPNQAVVAFRRPAILSAPALAFLGTSDANSMSDFQGALSAHCFLGCAAAYEGWSGNSGVPFEEGVSKTIREMLSFDGKELGFEASNPDCPGREHLATNGDNSRWDLEGGVLQTPHFGAPDDLTFSFESENGIYSTFVHQDGRFCDQLGALQIRAPASMLTSGGKRMRAAILAANGETAAAEFLFQVPPSQLKPWMLSAFLNRGGAGNPIIRAFAEGVGCRIAYAEDEPEILRDIPVVWGVLRGSDRILAAARAQELTYFYIDHAYFNRGHGKSYRITRNGYEAGPVRRCPPDRWEACGVRIEPWRRSGREIIVCPPTEYFMQAHNCSEWLATTLSRLEGLTDRPIIIRSKPRPGEKIVPLYKALETAHALVTHSSNVAIESACLGTPVFVAPESAAAPIGLVDLTDIEAPVFPERESWLAHLAYNQFSFAEVRSGEAWRMLLELEERELA